VNKINRSTHFLWF